MKTSIVASVVFGAATLSACGGEIANGGGSGSDVAASQDPFTDGSGPLRGHEDLTRFGIGFANSLLAAETGTASFFTPIPSGQACDGSESILLAGNCATDTPDSTMTSYYGVSALSWQTAPTLQELHFLRNYVGASGVEGAKLACTDALAHIITIANLAVSKWRAGDRAGFDYWVGHAVHTIQDSFSAAHTSRGGTLLRTLDDVCSYGRQVNGVCYHQIVDTRDRIWNSSWSCQLDPTNRSWGCLTPQAQSAAYATGGFLRVMGHYVHSGASGDLAAALTAWYSGGSVDSYSNYFHCETLH